MNEKVDKTPPQNTLDMPQTVVPGRLYQLIGELMTFTAQIDQGVAPRH